MSGRSSTPTRTSSSSALPNFLHEEAVGLAAARRQGRPLHEAARPQGRRGAADARGRRAGGRLRRLPRGSLLHAEDAQGDRGGARRARSATSTWVRSRETHPGPHSAWFWDGRLTGGGAIIDLGCHCIEIIRNFVGKGNRPVEVMCTTDTLVHPIDDEDNAIALIQFESGAIGPVRGQLDVPWRHGPPRRGRRDPRHDLAEPLPADRLRDVLGRRRRRLRRREGREAAGWLFPVGDEVSELGYVDMFSDMFRPSRRPRATRDVLRRLRRERGHGRRLSIGEERAWESVDLRLAGRHDARASADGRDVEGQTVIKREILPDGRTS